MTSTSLTKGAIAKYLSGNTQESALVKVVSFRACDTSAITTTGADQNRYRLAITDGQDTFSACMLSPELNNLIRDKELCENSIIKLEKVVHNLTSTGKSFLLILKLTVVPQSPISTTTNNKPGATICPIDLITPYLNGVWKIRARCFSKSAIRPHPVCDFDFVDASGEIRLVAFRDECTRFHPIIEVDKIYDISGVKVKVADKRWNNLRHNYELTLSPISVVRSVDDETVNSTIPDIHYDFVSLRDVSKHNNESYIDVLGIVDTCSSVIPFTNRTTNRDSVRREVTLMDEDTTISVTLWDEQAKDFDEELAQNKVVVAFHRARLAIYNNKYSLSGHKNMLMKVNPNLTQAKHLRIWYDAGDHFPSTPMMTTATNSFKSSDAWKTIAQIESEQLGRQGHADYITIKALCMHIADDRIVYMSCSSNDCFRKVNQISSGLYRCDKCRRDSKEYRWTYMFRAELVDSTGAIWVTFFRQQAQELMSNVTAEDFAQAKEDGDTTLMQMYINKNVFREKIFRLRVNEETFNELTMVKISCISISDVNFSEHGRRLIDHIKSAF